VALLSIGIGIRKRASTSPVGFFLRLVCDPHDQDGSVGFCPVDDRVAVARRVAGSTPGPPTAVFGHFLAATFGFLPESQVGRLRAKGVPLETLIRSLLRAGKGASL
jgi:hypothetical protein